MREFFLGLVFNFLEFPFGEFRALEFFIFKIFASRIFLTLFDFFFFCKCWFEFLWRICGSRNLFYGHLYGCRIFLEGISGSRNFNVLIFGFRNFFVWIFGCWILFVNFLDPEIFFLWEFLTLKIFLGNFRLEKFLCKNLWLYDFFEGIFDSRNFF